MKSKKAVSPLVMVLVVLIIVILTGVIIVGFYSVAAPEASKQATASFFGPLAPLFIKLASLFGIDVSSGIVLNEGDIVFVAHDDAIWKCVPNICISPEPGEAYRTDRSFHQGCWEVADLGKKIYGLDVADVDNDGRSDIIMTHYGEWIFKLSGDKEKNKLDEEDGANLWGVDAADIDEDGNAELVAANSKNGQIVTCTGGFSEGGVVWFYQLPGDVEGATCLPKINTGLSNREMGLGLADLNEDFRYNDVIVSVHSPLKVLNYLMIYDLDKPNERPLYCKIKGSGEMGIGVGDVDDDSYDEIVISLGGLLLSCETDDALEQCSKLEQFRVVTEDNIYAMKELNCKILCVHNQPTVRGAGVVRY